MIRSTSNAILLGISVAASATIQAQTQNAQTNQVRTTAESQPQDDPLIRGFENGKVIADVRLRYETVDDSINDDAEAMTVRTRLGYQTGSMGGFKLLGEFTDTRTLFGINDYKPEQADSDYAVIADPSNTEVNRAVVSYEGWKHTWLGLGRQRIILDNARWVGNVGWRQKEQTYDAASIDLDFGSAWNISYDYMGAVQGVVPALDFDASNHVLNVAFSGWRVGSLVGYGYFLKDEDSDDINNTVGLRFAGSTQPASLKWLYAAEYARQAYDPDVGSSSDAGYYHLMGGLGVSAVTFKLGYEVLGSDGGDYGLQTPLATKFKFNGWADLFLNTPADGLRDAYLDLSANWLGLKWVAVYHDFRADDGGDRYGDELDLHISKAFGKHYLVGAKYAKYRADDFLEDRSKIWLWFDFKY